MLCNSVLGIPRFVAKFNTLPLPAATSECSDGGGEFVILKPFDFHGLGLLLSNCYWFLGPLFELSDVDTFGLCLAFHEQWKGTLDSSAKFPTSGRRSIGRFQKEKRLHS